MSSVPHPYLPGRLSGENTGMLELVLISPACGPVARDRHRHSDGRRELHGVQKTPTAPTPALLGCPLFKTRLSTSALHHASSRAHRLNHAAGNLGSGDNPLPARSCTETLGFRKGWLNLQAGIRIAYRGIQNTLFQRSMVCLCVYQLEGVVACNFAKAKRCSKKSSSSCKQALGIK